MILDQLIDFYWYHIRNLKRHERKLIKYQGFGDRSIIKFKRESGLGWKTISKLLDSIKILDGLELRNHIRAIYNSNKELFIKYLFDTPISRSIALAIYQAFNSQNHAWHLAEYLNRFFAQNPNKKAEYRAFIGGDPYIGVPQAINALTD